MSENNGNNSESKTTQELEFQEFVKQQFDLLFAQTNQVSQKVDDLRGEMIERFLQLSRQIRDLDSKVDIYTREHSYMKDDIREVRAKVNL
ncbi:MAG TPA: hypothetical protein PLD20_15330 [Blastocatellia bacterium]|nr:hypothetical protein [Blastocatellia bacterium]HMV84771.1 hypothetical protein [Blastocatellia bacterium]HMX25634.1 hypothetical protein [Blastocatellia bacterium]HMY70217.1 hypothetical protein [Blastocatellia bacterium]HMZ19307.1 hypothetical protein [Blastocatellia bacterium]